MITTNEPLRHDGESFDPGDEVTNMSEEEAEENGLVALGIVERTEELPDRFPGRDELHAAGKRSMEAVAAVDDLQSIEGIGPKTADAIQDAVDEHRTDE